MRWACALAAIGIMACESPPVTCAEILVSRVSPGDTSVAVGAAFNAHLSILGGCGGETDITSHYSTSWATHDSTIATVDQTGRVTTLRAGSTLIDGLATENGSSIAPRVVGTVKLTVR